MTGTDVGGRVIFPYQLQQEIEAAGIPLPHGLTVLGPDREPWDGKPPAPNPLTDPLPEGTFLFTYDDQGEPADLPPGAADIVANYEATL